MITKKTDLADEANQGRYKWSTIIAAPDPFFIRQIRFLPLGNIRIPVYLVCRQRPTRDRFIVNRARRTSRIRSVEPHAQSAKARGGDGVVSWRVNPTNHLDNAAKLEKP